MSKTGKILPFRRVRPNLPSEELLLQFAQQDETARDSSRATRPIPILDSKRHYIKPMKRG